MGINSLTTEDREFLGAFLGVSGLSFRPNEKRPIGEAAAYKAGALAGKFFEAAGIAYAGTPQQVDEALVSLQAEVAQITEPALRNSMEQVKATQRKLFSRADARQKQRLGSYAGGIF